MEPGPETAPDTGPELDEEGLSALFAEAEGLFLSEDQPASLPLFGEIVDTIESHLANRAAAALAAEFAAEAAGEVPEEEPEIEDAGAAEAAPGDEAATPEAAPPELPPEVLFLSDSARDLLARSLGYRAEVQLSFGESDLARSGFERMLEVQPGSAVDRLRAPPELLKLFDQVRRQLVGDVTLNLEPPEVEVTVDGRRVEARLGPIGVLAGPRWLEAARPGYAPLQREIGVEAGRQSTYDLALERLSPVVRLHTRPSGTTVLVDGQILGTTSGTAPEGYVAAGGVYRHDEFSAQLVLTEVALGLRVLEIKKDGFRPYRAELLIEELIDYPMPPIVLEEVSGVLVFRNLPADGRIQIDGVTMQPKNPGSRSPRITLPPGEHLVTVASGASRMFSRTLMLADRQTVEVNVRLLPGLAFLGVLGADRATSARFTESFKRSMADSDKWAFLDHSEAGPRVLASAGISAETVQAFFDPSRSEPTAVDWKRAQTAVDRDTPGMIYVTATLASDLLATEASLLVWPTAPGPAGPDRIPFPAGEPGAITRLARVFDQQLRLSRPWVGALLIDSAAAPHPVVADVTPGSPAETAGIRLGDMILGAAGLPVLSRAAFDERVAAATAGETFDVAVQSAGQARRVEVVLGASPLVAAADGSFRLDAVRYTDLTLREEEATFEDRWVIQLNRALILLRAGDWDEAVRQLRAIEAPQSSHGVSQATVDYWLGLALANAGGQYRDSARQMLERAGRAPGARLYHHDDAFLAPRAKARLLALGGGG